MMMNQGVNTQIIAPVVEPNSSESRYASDTNQGQTSSYDPSSIGSETSYWTAHGMAGNHSAESGVPLNYTYLHNQQTDHHSSKAQDGLKTASLASPSISSTANTPHEYSSYPSYSNPTQYAYGSTSYPGYYSDYQNQQHSHSYSQQQLPNYSYSQQQPSQQYSQQQLNQQYSQPPGAYQSTGAPHQPLSSFQNAGSYAGTSSYSTTYYNHGDYQTAGGYPSSGYNSQTSVYGSYANYAPQQYSNYTSDGASSYSSGAAASTPTNYQHHYNQWANYYSQTEVTCAPGTEHLSVTSAPNQGSAVPAVTGGYATSHSQPPPPVTPSWRPESTSSELPSLQQPVVQATGAHDGYWKQAAPTLQNHHASTLQPHFQKSFDSKTSYNNFQEQHNTAPQGPNPYSATHQVSQSCQTPMQAVPSLDTWRANKLQIPTNPRIASNMALGLSKTDKDGFVTGAAAKPAYISVSVTKTNEKAFSGDAADSSFKPGMFPTSLTRYVEKALSRCRAYCKEDTDSAVCQAIMKEIITKARADGTLYTRNWDTEPLFPLPNTNVVHENSQNLTPVSSLLSNKRSPSRKTKSRWEPLPEEKLGDKPVSVGNDSQKYGAWNGKPLGGNSESKVRIFNNFKFSIADQKSPSKNFQRPVKRQRLTDALDAAENGDGSSDSDKEQSLTAYYSGAVALTDSPEEKKRRESRSKRFEQGQGHRPEINHLKHKNAGAGNLYGRRASALILSKSFDDGGLAVEDIDWDALTVKGTCQEIEKRYLRLTSAPDPSTVRPEEVLEKALLMVQNSQKNYLYKCDQLKSIRQDLTVQRIRNQLTVKVYETHARLALEVGDLPEFNQCQSQLKTLYAEGIEGCRMEFAAYNLLCVILQSNNNREFLSSMSRLTEEAKKDEAVKHALAVRAAVALGNYVMFFRLYKSAPNLNACFMDLCIEKIRYRAVNCMSRSYRPTLPISYIARVLGFSSKVEGTEEKHSDGLDECVEWLKAHGACLTTDGTGEMQLDAKATSSSLYMPEPEDAVAHGDANLAVNDFLTKALL